MSNNILTLAQNLVNTLTPNYIRTLDKSEKEENIKKLKKYARSSEVRNDPTLEKEIKKEIYDITTRLECNPTDNYNEMILAAREKNSCDEHCQFRKKAKSLREKCMEAKKYESVDEEKAIIACKKYYVFTHGKEAWMKHREEELLHKVNKIILKLKEKIGSEAKEILHKLETYDGLYSNIWNVSDLYKTLLHDNIALKKNIKIEHSDILTSDRKTEYEDEEINRLKNYYFIILCVYVILVIVFLISIFAISSQFNLTIKTGMFVALCLLPLLIPHILSRAVYIGHKIYDIIPKNVSLNIV